MKVLHYHFGKDGGAEKFFVHLLNAFAGRGVEQKIVIRPDRPWKANIHPSVEVAEESHFRIASLDRIALPMRMKALAGRWKPDCILAWMPRAAQLVGSDARAIRLVRLGDYPKSLKKFGNIDTIVCNTPDIARHVKELGWRRGIEVISNFTDAEPAAPVDRAKVETPRDAFVVFSMGRFVKLKGFDTLIRAIASVPNAWLWLAGSGVEDGPLRALAKELGIAERVKFLGWQADTRPFLAASDCFVMPSRHEPLGNVVLEAWAQRTPVVSTRAEGPSWFVDDGENGLLVDIDDSEGMAAAIRRVRGDEELRRMMVEQGWNTLDRQFSQRSVVDAYLKLFASRAGLAATTPPILHP